VERLEAAKQKKATFMASLAAREDERRGCKARRTETQVPNGCLPRALPCLFALRLSEYD
jgi:hypothetical protein